MSLSWEKAYPHIVLDKNRVHHMFSFLQFCCGILAMTCAICAAYETEQPVQAVASPRMIRVLTDGIGQIQNY